MGFQLTKIIGAIGVLSLLLLACIAMFTPIERQCNVDYYGRTDSSALAENILDLQISSYKSDYNYHRALNARNCTRLYGEFYCMLSKDIQYHGENVREGKISRYDAIIQIIEQVDEFYDSLGLAQLRISWKSPIIIMDDNMMSLSLNGLEYQNCTAIMNITNGLDLKQNDNITCYIPPFGGSSCHVYIEKYTALDGISTFFTYVTGMSFITVLTVVLLAFGARLYKKLTKRNRAMTMKAFSDNDDDYNHEEEDYNHEEEDYNHEDDYDTGHGFMNNRNSRSRSPSSVSRGYDNHDD